MRRIIMAVLALGLVACDKSEPKDGGEPIAPTTAAQQPESKPDEAAPQAATTNNGGTDYASMKDEEWCPAAHADTVKIVEAMKATMKKAGVEDSPDEYTPPDEARYVELCGKLPTPMQKCLVVGYAARNRDACQAALDGLSPEAKAAYAELMGK